MSASIWNPNGSDITGDLFDYTALYAAATVGAALKDRGLSVKDYPFLAKGDGVTDDTAAIQAALDTGANVFFPGVDTYYKVSAELSLSDYQTVDGDGYRSCIRQVTSLLNVFSTANKSYVNIRRVRLYCPGDSDTLTNGAACLFSNCTEVTVEEVIAENCRGWAISIFSSVNYALRNNWIINAPQTGIVDDTDLGGDIQVIYSSGQGTITGNHCISQSGTGIKVQSVVDPDDTSDVIIAFNIVKDAILYGIAIYRNSQTPPILQTVKRILVLHNNVNGVSGDIPSSVTGTYVFGSGIYSQGAEDIIIAHNELHNTHSAHATITYSSTLAPGAIGVTNQSRFTISHNNISAAGHNGIDIADGNLYGELIHGAIIDHNILTNVINRGIRIRTLRSLAMTGNELDTIGNTAVEVNLSAPATNCESLKINTNSVRNSVGTSFVLSYCNLINGSGNTSTDSDVSGLTISNSTDINLFGTTIKNHAIRGIQIASSCSRVNLFNSSINGTGTSTEGYRFDAATRYSGLRVAGCTTDYTGNFAPWQTLTVNSTTPTVLDATDCITANTLATLISNFTNGYDTQEIFVQFTDANTTLDFSASNLIGNNGVDRAMAVGDAIRAKYRASTNRWYVTIVDA